MHEFDADRRAVGALEDFDHFANARVFEAEHVVDEDLAVEILLLKPVVRGRKLVVVLNRGSKAERIELGMQVATGAIGADHHDGADGIARRLKDICLAHGSAGGDGCFLSLRLDLLLDDLFDRAPIAVQRGDEFAVGRDRPVVLFPGGALGCLHHIFRPVGERLEEGLPFGRDGRRVRFIACLELLDIGGVGAVQKRSELELLVGLLPCHGLTRTVLSAS
ncbi:hypothetical protein D9M70_403590 [compost metagenome]